MDSGERAADYVLFYAKMSSFQEDGCCSVKHLCRRIFEQMATDRGLVIDKHSTELAAETEAAPAGKRKAPYKAFYWGVRATARALLDEAEHVKLELPLKNWDGNPLAMQDSTLCERRSDQCCCGCATGPDCLEPDDSDCGEDHKLNDMRLDFVSAPFVHSKKHLFYGISADTCAPAAADEECKAHSGDDSLPLTGAQRIYLTHSILNRIDIHKELRRALGPHPGTKLCPLECVYCRCLKKRIIKNAPIVLEHLLEARVFADAYAVHDRTDDQDGQQRCQSGCGCWVCICFCRPGRKAATSVQPEVLEVPEATAAAAASVEAAKAAPDIEDGSPSRGNRTGDLRQRLSDSWHCCCGNQPLRLIRMYFGERLAFYYAWFGFITSSLMSLAGIALGFLAYGLVNASLLYKSQSAVLMTKLTNSTKVPTDGNLFTIQLIEPMQYVNLMFENRLTIPFGCVLTAWSLTTAESWKSHEATLSHRWDVSNHALAEHPKPGFTPKKPVHYPACCRRQPECRRCFGTFTFVVLCMAVVVAVAVAFEVSKLAASNEHCQDSSNPARCVFLSIILPIAGHLLVMAFLDWVYSRLAKMMTDWENHKYQSDHDTAYAMKAFAFRCANNYASLFYIAFVRQQDAYFGELTDSCKQDKLDIDCLSLLSVYTAGYIIGKSLLKCITDCANTPANKQRLMSCCCTSAQMRRLLCTWFENFRRAAYDAELRVLTALEKQRGAGMKHDEKLASPTALQLTQERHMAGEKSGDEMLDDYLEKMILHGHVVLFGSACYVTPLATLIALILNLRLDTGRLINSHRRSVPQPAAGIGVWSRLQDLLGHGGILSTGAILAFTSQSLTVHGLDPSTANRTILFIVFIGVMYLYKYMMAACHSGRLNGLKMQQKWKYHQVPKILHTESVPHDAEESLAELNSSDRWYHVMLPCFAHADLSRPEAAVPHQV